MSSELPREVRGLLDTGFLGYLGTSDRDRMPHITPVLFVYDGESIFLSTSKQAKKLRNIRENSRVSFLIHHRDSSDLYHNMGVLIHGAARTFDLLSPKQYPRLIKIMNLFPKKYTQYAKQLLVKYDKIAEEWKPTLLIKRVLIEIKMGEIVFMQGGEVRKVIRQT